MRYLLTTNKRSHFMPKREALEFLKIDITEWNELETSVARKNKYHKMIIKEIVKNHPDKHPEAVNGSPEHTQWVENTKLLNSIDYENCAEPANTSYDQTSSSSSSSKTNHSTSNQEHPQSHDLRKMFPHPKNAKQLINGIINGGYRSYTMDGRGNDYYEAFKELIPNMVPWSEWSKLSYYAGRDYGFVVCQIATKMYLEGYAGAENLLSAFVSQNKNRIKESFDQMVSKIKSRNFFMRFFSSTESQLNQFIDKFCQFTPEGGKRNGLIVGINASTVLLLCQSLNLSLPYNIIDPNFDLDQELIRMLLTNYVLNKNGLQLEVSKTMGLPRIQ